MDHYQELEIILKSNTKGTGELDFNDRCSDLYAAIKTLEKIERHYSKDNISSFEYESECRKLISHCKTSHDAVRTTFPTIQSFLDAYGVTTCASALVRLQRSLPATLEHADVATPAGPRNPAIDVNLVTEALIMIIDMGQMNPTAVPVDALSDPIDTAIKVITNAQYLVPHLEGFDVLKGWKARVNEMRASDLLSENDLRQLKMDAENVYRNFKDKLKQ